MKKCNCCGKVYDSIPAEAKLELDCIAPGYYFNCECKSTLIFPLTKEDLLRVPDVKKAG